jgi:signal peptidase II
MVKKRSILMNFYFLLTGIVIMVIDQVTKHMVSLNIGRGESLEIIPGFLYIVNVKNTGAAFGILQDYTKVLTIISFVAILLIIILKIMLNFDYVFYNITLGFILGGALGNLIDRFFIGEVTDFISFTIFPPVFNLADSFLVIGFTIIIILILKEYIKKDRTGEVENKRH